MVTSEQPAAAAGPRIPDCDPLRRAPDCDLRVLAVQLRHTPNVLELRSVLCPALLGGEVGAAEGAC